MGQVLNIEAFSRIENPLLEQPPILKMSKALLQKQAKFFIENFAGETSYAVKANSESLVIAELVKAGITTFDVASLHEMKIVRDILPTATLHYHNPIRSHQEVSIALHLYGCKRFSVDHIDALQALYEQASDASEIEVAIRFRMETQSKAVQSFKSKFGVLRDEAVSLLEEAHKMGFKTGMTFHPGSQTTSPAPYLEHMEEAKLINGQLTTDIDFLNIGGGFPSQYKGLETAPLQVFFDEIKSAYEAYFKPLNTHLECEPGRSLVANAGTLVTEVKVARSDRRELYLNDGIYGGLMEFHQFPDLFPEYVAKQNSHKNLSMNWTVYGPTCDPVDVLPYALDLPETIKAGDIIEFHGVGAYSTATATRFNGYGAIEVRMI